MDDKEQTIAAILALEQDMFLSVPSAGPASCQKNPDGFRLHRGAQFSIWSGDTLKSYRNDLNRAKADGKNLMTRKYARMENLIERQNPNPFIGEMVVLQLNWQREMVEKHPGLMASARPVSGSEDTLGNTSFETYLRSELETYSDATLALLHRDLTRMEGQGVNGSAKIYEHLVKSMGYDSIEAVERQQKKR